MPEEQSRRGRLLVTSLRKTRLSQIQLAPALSREERCQVPDEQSLQGRLLVTSLLQIGQCQV